MQVAIFGRQIKEHDIEVIRELLDVLKAERINIFVLRFLYEELEEHLPDHEDFRIFDSHLDFKVHKIDCAIVLGGRRYHSSSRYIYPRCRCAYFGHQFGQNGLFGLCRKETD